MTLSLRGHAESLSLSVLLQSESVQQVVYATARDQLLSKLSPEKLQWIKDIATRAKANKLLTLGKAELEQISESIRHARRAAQEMRAVMRLLSHAEDGENDQDTYPVPERFHRFIVELGKFRDAIDARELTWNKARNLLQVMIDFETLVEETKTFVPSPAAEVNSRLRDRVEGMLIAFPLFGRSPHTLDNETYHDLRKNLRDFEIVLKFLREGLEVPQFFDLEKVVGKASAKMGRANDKFEIAKIEARAEEKEKGLKKGRLIKKLANDLEVPTEAMIAADAIRTALGIELLLSSIYAPERLKKVLNKRKHLFCAGIASPSTTVRRPGDAPDDFEDP